MGTVQLPANGWIERPYQRRLWSYLQSGGKRAIEIAHRRWGKDDVTLHHTAIAAHERVGSYWHCLPEFAQGRKALWSAVNSHTGKRRIDEAFPHEIRDTTNEQEMFIRFKNGSTWQIVGSDRYNSLVGAGVAGVVFSEWALANPAAWAYIRPMIEENDGWAAFITTPRGRNHAKTMYDMAEKSDRWFAEISTVQDTKALTMGQLADALSEYMALYGPEVGQAQFDQEYMCSFNTALLGAILGRQVDALERAGKINDDVWFDSAGSDIEITSDIGFRDTASWWFWQRKVGGFTIADYEGASGMDAADWIAKLKEKPYRIGKIWLPHDARAKTFQSKHSVIEQFIEAFGPDKVGLVPQSNKQDQINAARTVLPRCEINQSMCSDGIEGLRAWSYEWNDDLKIFSRTPKHDWASHPSDAFSYGAQIMQGLAPAPVKDTSPPKGADHATLDQLWEIHERDGRAEGRI